MQYGTTTTVAESGDERDLIKDVIRKGKVIRRYNIKEEQRLVGSRGNEIKDITAHFFAVLKQYEAGEVNTFSLLADHLDPETSKISRIKIVTEKQETVDE